jgi:uncharacterized membrane protein
MDHPARTGLIGAAAAVGRSFQPNLLTRGTVHQAIITGATSAGGYGLFSTGDSVIHAVASRISRSEHPGTKARVGVALGLGAVGVAVATAMKWREHEPRARAATRLAGRSAAVLAGTSIVSSLTGHRDVGRRTALVAATGVGAASWLATQPWKATPGSLIPQHLPGAVQRGTEHFFEDSVREVQPIQMAGIALGVGGLTYGLARVESALTNASSKMATVLVGGEPQDHRLAGRVTALGISFAFAYVALTRVSDLLSKGGDAIEPGHSTPPTAPEITGSPASGLAWSKQTREGARWLSMTLPPTAINDVMQESGAKQPIRVYASLEIADTDAARAEVLLHEIDRTQALQRKAIALFSPTGSGYVNYVANETFEYLMRGDCASAAIQYSVLPSALSLGKVPTGTTQTRMVVDGIVSRLMKMPEQERPLFFLFGESLGSQVSEDMFAGTWTFGPQGIGIDAALWIGTPSATRWRKEIWGSRTITQTPDVGPGSLYLPRSIHDWRELDQEARQQIRYLLLQNGDDPIPKFGSQVMWRKPDWLGPDRQLGAPHGTQWVPGTTFLMTFIDMLNALTPTPGTFAEGGHDYRDVIPDALRETWRLDATDEQMSRINIALRQRELAWELHRDRTAALAKPAAEQAEAMKKVLATATKYVGHDIDETQLVALIDAGLQPTT